LGNDNKLKKIIDFATIMTLLSGTKENNAEVYVWKLIGNTKHLGLVRIETIRKGRKEFTIMPKEGQEKIVHDLLGGDSSVNIYIPESALLLRCNIIRTDVPMRYYLQFPDFVVQVERRKHLRLYVHNSSEVQISFGKSVILPKTLTQQFIKDCYDLSAGGFSFLVSKMESKFFRLNEKIPLIELKAGTWSGNVSAQIVAINEIEPDEYNGFLYRVWRVSCRFSFINDIGRKYLEKFIFERIKDDLHAINE
jgi:hypothetical protein